MKKVFLVLIVSMSLTFISCGGAVVNDNSKLLSFHREIDYSCWPTACPGPFDPEVTLECYAEYMSCLPDGTEFPAKATVYFYGDQFDDDAEDSDIVYFDMGPPGSGGTQSQDASATKTTISSACSNLQLQIQHPIASYNVGLGGGCTLGLSGSLYVRSNLGSNEGGSIDATLRIETHKMVFVIGVGYCDPPSDPYWCRGPY